MSSIADGLPSNKRLPAVIAAFHLGYGWGTWQGLWDVLRKRTPAQRFARITR